MEYAQRILPHYTYNDYLQWEGRWELIEGHPIAMSPMPVPKHQRASGALYIEFELALRKKSCKNCKVYLPLDYKVAEDTILQPDLLIACNKLSKKFIDFTPVLVVEVLSPATVLRDRNTKFEIYQQQGVKYYLMVDIDKESFELYELQDYKYTLTQHDYQQPFTFLLDEGCQIELCLNEVWENI